MFIKNPFVSPTPCNTRQYIGTGESWERLMFVYYLYVYRSLYELPNLEEHDKLAMLLKLGEMVSPVGLCENKGCSEIARKICYFEGNIGHDDSKLVITDFENRCVKHARQYELLGASKHKSADPLFSSITLFGTMPLRVAFTRKLKQCLGLPEDISNELATKFFHDLYEKEKEKLFQATLI